MPPRPRAHAPRSKARTAPPARTVELDIADLGARGDGIAHLDGRQVFVPYTITGDRVLVRIEGERGDGLVGALVEILSPGPARQVPPCAHFGRCGGCALQHVTTDTLANWKRDMVAIQMVRHRLSPPILPVIHIPPGTRRRATFAFLRRPGATLLGFNARASHAVVDIEGCGLLEPVLPALLPALRRILTETVAEGGHGDITVTLTESGLDVLIVAPAALDLERRERLATFAAAADLARLTWSQPDSGLIEPIAHRRPAVVRFGGVAVEPPPGAFLQPSVGGETAIVERVLAAVEPGMRVADLFSGCGSFALPMAAHGVKVHAVEGEQAPLLALDAAARRAQLPVGVEIRDLARRPLLATELKKFQAVVFDPPRAGAQAQAVELAAGGPPVVIAVSCNPATLARDLRILVDGGYRLDSVTPIDQFPWAAHVETVSLLSH